MSRWLPQSREELEMDQMADIALRCAQAEWQPGKALAAAFGAGVAFATAYATAMAFLFSHFPR
jgi:hypothetical protein